MRRIYREEIGPLSINKGPRKSRFPLNVTYGRTYGQTEGFATKKYGGGGGVDQVMRVRQQE